MEFPLVSTIVLLLGALFGIVKLVLNRDNKSQIPDDILRRIKNKFPNKEDQAEVIRLVKKVNTEILNVGNAQLIRSILIIADTNKTKMKTIIESGYYGDPRDVIVEALGIQGNTNDHGMTPFED